ncbi:hypothetical protein SAMN05421788_101907 [Filimonas lacunae]|uniref:Uncharacterized protein n=1 Tax=Filimonas lacunae TaxID=477680 RepID=A0A173MP83_9BACT|nr:hypothetical protein [Filimonas lacunae]BAV09473.1 hypothetical protein FLA_5522 [Filimonas lacunae]SIS73803.1 hypothetical protein SAMN05421788_101907 [Filimonas lacunae]
MNSNYKHYLPSNDAELQQWTNTFHEKIVVLGSIVGLSATQITELETASSELSSSLQKVKTKKQEQKEAISAKDLAKKNQLKVITSIAANIKRAPGYTENLGQELGIVGSSTSTEKRTLTPTIKLTRYPDYIEVAFVKQNQPGISIYSRVKGSEDWKKLIGGATKSPYNDYSPVQPGQSTEVREYKARFWDNGVEIGQDSVGVYTVVGS